MGFVTTGNFNLAEGKGYAIGSILISKVVPLHGNGQALGGESARLFKPDFGQRLCIVRNSGAAHGRLASWDFTE
jgi:ribonuclease P/MRP protein subunit POP1